MKHIKLAISFLFTFLFFSFTNAQLVGTIDFTLDCFCNGSPDGMAQITASGGTPPYTFTINPNVPSQVISPETRQYNGLVAGTYTFTIEDAAMTQYNGSFTINEPPLLFASTSVVDDTCNQCIGSITTGITGGTAPYQYVLNGGPSMASATFNGLCSGNYNVVVTDMNGCITQVSQFVDNNTTAGGSAVGTISSTPAYCNNGSLFLNVTGGAGPFSIEWVTGDTLAMVNNLAAGTYNAVVTDSLGCQNTFTGVIADSSNGQCATISGNAFADVDQNCTNNGEVGIQNVTVSTQPGNYVAITDQNGDYSLNVPFGNYDVEQGNNQWTNTGCNSIYSVLPSVSNPSVIGIDFADSLGLDLEAVWNPGLIRTVLPNIQYLQAINHSPLQTTGDIYYVPDPNYTVVQTTPAYDSQNGDTLFWNNVNLNAFDTKNISIQGNTTSTIGTVLEFCYGVLPVGNDIDTSNNEHCENVTVIASYDPNDKQVWPSGDIELSDEVLTYKIRFQNTGTDTAFNIFILDTLSSHLDPSTFEFVSASHYCIPSYADNNVLKFSFPNIMLPDSNINEPLSHGFVNFRIRQNTNNQVGNVIENTAGIYFDFNAPVITNTTESPIVEPSATIEEQKITAFSVYPNPSKNIFNIQFEEKNSGIIRVFDLQGRVLSEQQLSGQNRIQLDASNWTNGLYIIQWIDNNQQVSKRIVKH